MYPIKRKPNAFYSSYRMSQSSSQCQPTISDCYDELMADSFLLQSFSEEKRISVHGLPYMCAVHFCVLLERHFTQLTSPALWGKAGADFIIYTSQRAVSAEIAPLAILVMGWVGKGKLGMITTFCRSDQAKVEPLDALLNLVHWDLPERGVVVVKVFTKLPLSPVAVLWLPLPGCNHPFNWHFNHSIPTCLVCPFTGCFLILPLRSFFHEGKREMG